MLSDAQAIATIVESAVTTAALVIGGAWAYFKFLKGRVFHPRLAAEPSGHWREIDGRPYLHARVIVKNIGASKTILLQRGTWLSVGLMNGNVATEPPTRAKWEWQDKNFSIFADHDWVEPGEAISDEMVLDLGVAQPSLTMLEVRLIWKRRWPRRNVDITQSRIIPIDGEINEGLEVQP